MERRGMKALIKDFVPPIVLRLAGTIRHPLRAGTSDNLTETSKEGRERGPEFYDRTFLHREHWRRHYTESRYYALWTVIADRIARAGVTSVLDIGCGPGQVASLLRDKGLPRYLGIDFSPERIEQAKRICPEFEFVLADAFETDLLSAYDYDAVVCTEFLEHVKRDEEVLDKIRAGTRFYGTVPSFPGPSHVRHFEDAQEVMERYGRHFQDFSVDIHFANKGRGRYFLMEGLRL